MAVMATKYEEYYQLMLENNKKEFDEFRIIHDQYALDPDKNQEEYNKIGEGIQRIIRQWEDKLCGHSEGSGYGNYSGGLAEKFWNRIRKDFPEIDSIGIVVFKVNKITPK